MAQWEITLKDGRTLVIDGPRQPTPEEAQRAVNRMSPEQMAAMTRPAGLGGNVAPSPIPKPSEFETAPDWIDKAAMAGSDPDTYINALPAIGGTVGGIAGGVGGALLGAPAGGVGAVPAAYGGRIAGSALGAGTGETLRQFIQRARGQDVKEGWGEVGKEAAISGGLDAVFPGLKAGGRALYSAAVKNMPQNLLRESPQLIERALAERIPATWAGVQKAGRRAADFVQNALDAGTTTKGRSPLGTFNGRPNYHPDAPLMAEASRMGRVGQMVEGAITPKPPNAAGVVVNNAGMGGNMPPLAKTAISTIAGGPVGALMMGTAETADAVRKSPAALSGLGIGVNELGNAVGSAWGRAGTEMLRYWETLKALAGDDEPGAP